MNELEKIMDGKKLYPSKYAKYLGVLIDSHLTFSYHMNSISTKLSRSVGLLTKIRHYVTKDTLLSIYFGIFSSIITYAALIWWQIKSRHLIRLVTLQNKAIKIINFTNIRDRMTPLYKAMKIIKLSDKIRINNFSFVFDDFSGLLQNVFQLSASYSYVTRSSTHKMVKLPIVRTTVYRLNFRHPINTLKANYFILKASSFVRKPLNNFIHNLYIISIHNITM